MRSAVIRKEEKKKINPVWRGIGCLLFVAIFVTAFIISTWFIAAVTAPENPLPLPSQLRMVPGALKQMKGQFGDMAPWIITPEIGRAGRYFPELLLSTVVAVIIFGFVTAFYSIFRGNINDPRDARKYQPTGRRKRNVRKCR